MSEIEIPKPHASYRGKASGTVIIGKERAFTEQEAAEVIRRAEAYEGVKKIADIASTLFYGFEDFLGTDAIGKRAESFYETIEELKQALKEQP